MTLCNLTQRDPSLALAQGCWFKLICGASYQYLPAIRNLALVYTLAGVDCIDVAADVAVVTAARAGITAAFPFRQAAADRLGIAPGQPWLMISLKDGEDPHFRKAYFEATNCPQDCSQPCVSICPADAIAPTAPPRLPANQTLQVIPDRCYGCGRCLPVCPPAIIEAHSLQTTVAAIAPQLVPQVEAIEIHTQVGRQTEFARCWQTLRPYLSSLKLVSISCPDGDYPDGQGSTTDDLIHYLQTLYQIMQPLPGSLHLIWQTDGRSMSGDIGKGTTHSAIKLGQKVLNARLPGHVQLAGGTNQYTVDKLKQRQLLRLHSSLPRQPGPSQSWPTISGIAYGSYARRLVQPLIDPPWPLETLPDNLWRAVSLAHTLVSQLKAFTPPVIPPTPDTRPTSPSQPRYS
jgi:Fe-S-cluster-containing hydrogenase component 2